MTKVNKYISNDYQNFFDSNLSSTDPDLYNSIKQDCVGTKRFTGFFAFLSSDDEKEKDYDSNLYKLSVALAFIYALSMSFLSWDFVMSLHPHFYSTLFGVYYFVASLFSNSKLGHTSFA